MGRDERWGFGVSNSDGVEIYYRRTGGTKPALVLLHGLAASGACWRSVACGLEDRFDVVMPDARGHGNSSAPLHGYTYEDHANDVAALIQQIGLAAPIVLGHSMGGMTAALLASRMDLEIGSVILADPTFISPQMQRDVRDSDVADQHRRILGLDKESLSAELRAKHPHRSPELIALIAEARLQTRMSAFDVLTPPNPDYRSLIRAIDIPIALVIADAGVISRETAAEIQTLNPAVRIEQIQNAGHALHFDQPERFINLLRSLLP